MPQIEIPFTIGQRVRTPFGQEHVIIGARIDNGYWSFSLGRAGWFGQTSLTLVEEPVIEWKRDDRWGQWRSDDWYAKDDGSLLFGAIGPHLVGTFDDPRAVGEATQKLWNEARKA